MHLLQSKAATRLRTMLVTNLQSSLTVMMNKDRPSLMQRKFMQFFAEDDASEGHTSSQCWEPEPFRKQYCFFYGTLMDPPTLARILQLPEPPTMRPAKVVGYHIKLWGPYPALLTGPPLHPVDGLAYKVQSQEQLNRLSAYETSKYRIKACMIKFPSENGGEEERVRGIVFIWNGESEELREGSFTVEKWLDQRKKYI
ncbi:unnamed protein product [Penicillium nalgiovense]|uniref:Putative gamma-glutamylcyclotransferase n=1 Tax=Penicillium nalgiovense TaxID=60175 RepID=A0A1V6WK41_PENNA|nr:hypothetical protein PENNAL_c0251G11059 [Penicillium nalgiovense]CAG7937610.1 unnamed protein product [Penicillium nalgiovense]CAG7943115.1 unnamed protein product [Penicillium nalgiovense]CAG7961438.1 unnamed protein product [Penicillium nalgiovense]CAG7969286.1 unnamed protein product [Penicillium nalgiovense]